MKTMERCLDAHGEAQRSANLRFTRHARHRMSSRRLSDVHVALVKELGRCFHGRGARIYVIGRKEIVRYQRRGIDLRALEGIHVVCSLEGAVITTYRNRELRGIKGLRN